MFKILLIVMSLNGSSDGHITAQVIGSYDSSEVCVSIANQLTRVHKFPENQDYNDFEVSAKCFQSTDKQ